MLAVTALLARRVRLLRAPACTAHAQIPAAASTSLLERVAALHLSESRAFSTLDEPNDTQTTLDDAKAPAEAAATDATLQEEPEFQDLLAPPTIVETLGAELGDGHVYADSWDEVADFDDAVDAEVPIGEPDNGHHDQQRHGHVDGRQQPKKQSKPHHAASPSPRRDRSVGPRADLRKQLTRAQRRLRRVEADELDYEHELESVWSAKELKERQFKQALRREADKYRVCRNCGERGHVARNCLVPVICSNCGNIGHLEQHCRFPSFDSMDAFLQHEEYMQKREQRWGKTHAHRGYKNPTAVPKVDPTKVIATNEKLRDMFQLEVDEYLEEEAVRVAKEKKQAPQKKQKQHDGLADTPKDA